MPNALARTERELGSVDVVRELVDFIRRSTRGVSSMRDRVQEVTGRSLAA
jgi:hypothetical protein